MSTIPRNALALKRRHIPGVGFLKNFFKIHGPIVTLKGMWFYYYSQLKLRRLSLDPSKEHIVKVNDYDMLIIPTDRGISAELAMFSCHEPLSTRVLQSQLKRGMVCLDIGSNIGYYALLESRVIGKDGKVICIEPSELNFQYLKRNLDLRGQSGVEMYNIAVGDIDDHVNFVTDGQSNLCRVVGKDEYLTKNKISKIPMKRIDSLLSEISLDRLDFVRMDPEGYESKIYRGMKGAIERFRPMLFIEFHRVYLGIEGTRSILQELQDDGYESLYYIQRWMDHPIISSTKYIQRMSIMDLSRKLDNDSMPGVFSLLLVNNKETR